MNWIKSIVEMLESRKIQILFRIIVRTGKDFYQAHIEMEGQSWNHKIIGFIVHILFTILYLYEGKEKGQMKEERTFEID